MRSRQYHCLFLYKNGGKIKPSYRDIGGTDVRHLLLGSLAVALLLGGCTTARISTNSDPTQDFSRYATFGWIDETPATTFGARSISPVLQAEIAQSIKSALEAKGYRFTENTASADFAVSFTVGTREGFDTVEVPDYYWDTRPSWTWGTGYWPVGRAVPSTRTEVRDYTEGTLSIDVFDVTRRAPVWHGAGVKHLTAAELAGSGDVPKQVKKVLEGFPPG